MFLKTGCFLLNSNTKKKNKHDYSHTLQLEDISNPQIFEFVQVFTTLQSFIVYLFCKNRVCKHVEAHTACNTLSNVIK